MHDVIVDILKSARRPLTARQITDTIAAEKLRPKDGRFPLAKQVDARVNDHKDLFNKNGTLSSIK